MSNTQTSAAVGLSLVGKALEVWKRLQISIAAFLMWGIFAVYDTLAMAVLPVLITAYLFTGRARLYREVGNAGKAMDQLCNVVFLDGHPKETVSSHAGRYYEAKYGNPYKGRPNALRPNLVIPARYRFVHWLTDKFERDHARKAVEQWTIDAGLPLEGDGE